MYTQKLLDEIQERLEIIQMTDPDAFLKIAKVFHDTTHQVIVEKRLN